MSTHYSQPIKYQCLNDCSQFGCPGHTIRAVHHGTSDVLAFEIDGEEEYWFDYNAFKAMMEAYKSGSN